MDVSQIALLCAGFVAGTAVGGSLAMRWASWSREDEEETENLRAVEMRCAPYRSKAEQIYWPHGRGRFPHFRDGSGLIDGHLITERPFGRRAEAPPQPDYGRPPKGLFEA